MMRSSVLLVLAAACLAHQADAQHQQFYRWSSPANDLMRRQGPLPGYHPEFGTCGSGTTCENACGSNWLSCKASTDLSLFCYNKVDLGQSCCENGSGRACDRGYYCAWNTFGGRVWCCKDGQSRKECGVEDPPTTTSTTTTPIDPDAKTVTVTTTTTTTDDKGDTTTTTKTVTEPNDSCPSVRTETVTETATSVVTSVDTVTTVETVTVYTNVPPDVTIVTVYSTVSVTVTAGDGGCNPTSKPHHWPTKPGYPTKPGHHGSKSYPPDSSEPIRYVSHSGNDTTIGPTSTPALVTGGAGALSVGKLAMIGIGAVMFLL